MRAEINAMEINFKKTTTTTVEHISETRSWFYERINKIGKPLPSLIKKEKERTQINEIKN